MLLIRTLYLIFLFTFILTIQSFSNWTRISPLDFNSHCLSLDFANPDSGAVMSRDSVLVTTNGGSNWEIYHLNDVYLENIYFTKDLEIIACGKRKSTNIGLICKSSDFGKNWSYTEIDSAGDSKVYDIIDYYPIDKNIILASTGNSLIIRSDDGGINWETVAEFPKFNFCESIGFSGATGFICGGSRSYPYLKFSTGVIYKTTDYGKSWNELISSSDCFFSGLSVVAPDICYAVGYWNNQEITIKTTNGGISWDTIYFSPGNSLLWDCFFANSNIGVISGYEGTILITENGGDLWRVISNGSDETMLGVQFFNEKHGYAVGSTGDIWKYDRTSKVPQIAANLNRIDFGDVKLPANRPVKVNLEISNSGSDNLTLEEMSLINDTGNVFKLVTQFKPVSLVPNEFVSYEINFQPKEEIEYTANIEIVSNATNFPVKLIPLLGKGIIETYVPEHKKHISGNIQNIAIYPNPASAYIDLSLNKFISSEILIYNFLGECVSELTSKVSNSEMTRIDISKLQTGIYFIRAGQNTGVFLKE